MARRSASSMLRATSVALLLSVLAAGCVAAAAGGASVNLRITTVKTTYAAGEPIRFDVTVENRGTQPVTLRFRTAQRFDVRVKDSTGRDVWQWASDRAFAQALGEETLHPNERRHWEAVVAKPLPGGAYTVVGSL